MTEGTAKPLYLSIHYLRGIAALMVVAVHSFTYGLVPVDDLQDVTWLKHGVALFFVISGFVMVVSTQGRDPRAGDFMLRRIIRIAPLYWVVTLAWLTVGEVWDVRQLVGSLVFLPTPDPVTGALRSPVVEPGWTLNYEMFFYSLFAISLLLPARYRLEVLGGALLGIVVLGQMVGGSGLFQYYSSTLLLLFAAGMAMARYDLRLPAWLIVPGFVALALLPSRLDSDLIGVYLPAVVIVLAARSLDGRLPVWKVPGMLGDASYSIYLGHMFVIQLAFHFAVPYLPGPVTLLVMLVASSLVGVALHRGVEIPLSRWLRGRLSRRPVSKAPVPAA